MCEVRSHNKVRALFAENKVRFARAERLWTCLWLYLRFLRNGHLVLFCRSVVCIWLHFKRRHDTLLSYTITN